MHCKDTILRTQNNWPYSKLIPNSGNYSVIMKESLNIPDYSPNMGMALKWEDGYQIKVSSESGIISIEANKEGLISLANHFLTLAQDAVPTGMHIHLDEFNSLEEDSLELLIEKV